MTTMKGKLNWSVLLVLAAVIHQSVQQCLTNHDEIRRVSFEAYESLQQSELQFSTDLLRTATSLHPGANVLVSPAGVFQASLLAYFLSANQTERGLRRTLHLANNYDKLDILGAYNLRSYYQKLREVKSRSYQLSNANILFYERHLEIRSCMKVLFSQELYSVNFLGNAQGVLRRINNWVAAKTRNVIKDFLSDDSVTQDTQMVLVNAAYFKGKWKSPFSEEDTFKGKFHLSNGSQVPATMMSQDGTFKYEVNEKLGAEVLELPYKGEDISMFVMVPLQHSHSAVQDLVKKLDSKTLQKLVQALDAKKSGTTISVTIPKFTIEAELDLTTVLESMGVGDLFQASADLSVFGRGLGFSEASHKAKIRVDEEGTEAAAATSFLTTRMGSDTFVADYPFLFIIYDKTANAPLFFGAFEHPELQTS